MPKLTPIKSSPVLDNPSETSKRKKLDTSKLSIGEEKIVKAFRIVTNPKVWEQSAVGLAAAATLKIFSWISGWMKKPAIHFSNSTIALFAILAVLAYKQRYGEPVLNDEELKQTTIAQRTKITNLETALQASQAQLNQLMAMLRSPPPSVPGGPGGRAPGPAPGAAPGSLLGHP